jgi:hypothetical protein
MRHVLVLAALTSALVAASASADGACVPGEMTRRDDGTFYVCGRAERPGSTFILPRTRPEHFERELRRSFTDEIVREGDAL